MSTGDPICNKCGHWLGLCTCSKTMDFNELKYKAARVSDEKFGRDNPVTAPMLKLKEEIEEVLECIDKAEDPLVEFADCFLLLIDAYRKYYGDDIDMQSLINVASLKLDVVSKRKFGKPNEHGVFQHLPDESPKLIVTWADMDIPAIEKAYEDIKPLVLYEPCFKETRDKIKYMMEMALPNYKVKCDEENNPPDVVDSGNILVRVSDNKNSYVDVIF